MRTENKRIKNKTERKMDEMEELMEEYGSLFLAILAGIAVLGIVSGFLAEGGLFREMILLAGNGACIRIG